MDTLFDKLRFHHIGVATFDIEKTIKFYLKMGYSGTEIVQDTNQSVKVCFLKRQNEPLIEFCNR